MNKKNLKYFVVLIACLIIAIIAFLSYHRYLKTALVLESIINLDLKYGDTVCFYEVTLDKNILISLDHLTKRIKNEGDTAAFNKLDIIYTQWGYGDIFPYAVIMANKFKYAPAYLRVYEEIVKHNGGEIDKCSSETKRLALTYLEQYKKLCDN